jgi:signal transduction histidine kinase
MMLDADRLNNLINSILEIAGLEQKKVAHDFAVYPVETVVRSLVREASEQFNLPQCAIRIEGHASCQCVADRNALKIVFNNIIDNAIKYSAGKTHIDVLLKRTIKNAVVEFRDRGIGISSGNQKKVFDKFLRIYDPDLPSVKGTGLGLYWVREIIKYHGGRVSVYSEGRNMGSTFRVELPIYLTSKQRHINNLLKITQRRRGQTDSEEGRKRV